MPYVHVYKIPEIESICKHSSYRFCDLIVGIVKKTEFAEEDSFWFFIIDH